MSATPTPDISVVVPTYRRPDLLPRLVAALEEQTLGPGRFEVIVVDDGSGDGTADVLAELAARADIDLRPVVSAHNRGRGSARNLGWRSARGRYLAFTDDDCVPEPAWLEAGLRALERDANVGVLQGRTLKPEGDYSWTRWTVYREVLAPSPWFEGCNLFFRRHALEAAGGFDETMTESGEDTVAGWAVLGHGWQRGFEAAAVVRHDLVERGVWWHMRLGFREGNTVAIVRRYPQMRSALWRPWAVRPRNVAFAAGALGTLGARRWPAALVLWAPWVWLRRPPRTFHPWLRYLVEKWAVDAATFAGMTVAAVRHRALLL